MRELTDPASVTSAVLESLLAEPHQPRLTFYDADRNRTELSTASLANWSAKVAGLLTGELGAAPGETVSVLLPEFWQTLPVLLGCWWAGLVVSDRDEPGAVAAFVADGADPAHGVADEVFVVSGHPLGAPSRHIAAHQRDFTSAVLSQPDRFGGARVGPDAPALTGTTELSVRKLLTAAQQSGWPEGTRLLSDLPWALPDPGAAVLLGPLLAGGSVVRVPPGFDPDGEKVTARRLAG